MIHDFILFFLLATVPAAFSYFLDYCLGFPGKEQINTKAIFFGWSYMLARRRLKKKKTYNQILHDLKGFEQDLVKTTVFMDARKHFTWEQIFGMCIFCTNFYVSSIAATVFFFTIPVDHFQGWILFLIIPLYSHLILRKI